MNRPVHKSFLIFFGVLGIFPLFQQVFHPFRPAGLSGAFEVAPEPVFTYASLLNGTCQQSTDNYTRENTAFRGDLVRFRNQLDYGLFGNVNTVLTLGKDNFIFDPNYVFAYEGTDLLNDSLRAAKTLALIRSLHLLDSLQIPLIFCFAPNKAAFYAEQLVPKPKQGSLTNQSYFKNVLTRNHVPVIDCDSWFLSMKDSSTYPLIPKYGAHWSIYGAALAADTLWHVLRAQTGKDLASFTIRSIEVAGKPRFTDDDYLPSLNLIWKWPSPAMAYPALAFNPGIKPDILVISDSFLWSFYDLEIFPNACSPRSEMWYYNRSVFDYMREKKGERGARIRWDDIRNRDAIIVLATGASLKDFGFGFFDQLSTLAAR